MMIQDMRAKCASIAVWGLMLVYVFFEFVVSRFFLFLPLCGSLPRASLSTTGINPNRYRRFPPTMSTWTSLYGKG